MKTPISYYGGKQRMLRHILPLIPEHETYVEPFAGGAAVFWAKPKAPVEVLNDTNGELVNFYVVAKDRPQALARQIARTPNSSRVHDFAQQVYRFPEFFSPVRRAWATWFLANQSFSKVLASSWALQTRGSGAQRDLDQTARTLEHRRQDWQDPHYLEALLDRLRHVQLEDRDACYVLQQRDHPGAFHYVDPPYIDTHQGNYKGYAEADYQRLLDVLAGLQGRFMLSCFPSALMQQYAEAQGWHVCQIEQNIAAGKAQHGRRNRRKQECLVTNFTLG